MVRRLDDARVLDQRLSTCVQYHSSPCTVNRCARRCAPRALAKGASLIDTGSGCFVFQALKARDCIAEHN
jgi:hypothetical protein